MTDVATTDTTLDAGDTPPLDGSRPSEPSVAGTFMSVVRRHWELLALSGLVLGAVVAMFATHRHGHWWGDDWALYVRQAQGLVDGNAEQVRLDNEFTVTTTPGREFSPPLYPWGFPLLLSPFVAVFGTDLDKLAILEVACAAVFVVAWWALARRRLPALVTLAGALVLALSPLYVGWTEQIQSELPFMAVAMLAVVYVDHVSSRRALTEPGGSWVPAVVAGLAAAAAFTVRREGLAVVAMIGVAQLVGLHALWPRRPRARRGVALLLARLATPFAVAYGAIQLLQAVLPSTLVPRYRGTGLGNITKFADQHVANISKSLGFQGQWATSPSVLGNHVAGTLVVTLFLALAIAGIVLALARHTARDLPLLGYLLVVFTIGASFRVSSARYVATVGPILLLLAATAVVWLVGLRWSARVAAAAAVVPLLLLAVGNGQEVGTRIDHAQEFRDRGLVEWGPMDPAAVEMWAAVERLTEADDVVGFWKARAMTLMTDRRSIQVGGSSWPADRASDLMDVLVIQYADDQYPLVAARPDRYESVWGNSRFELFRVVPER
jgi:hypothetical protein